MGLDFYYDPVVYPTPGGAAGDGTMDGILSAKEYKLTAGTGGQFVNSDALAINTVQITANPAYATGSLLVGADGSLLSTNSPNSATPKWRTSGVGSVTTYLSLPTVGTGLSPIYGAGLRVALGTASTPIASFTPAAVGSFRVVWRLAAKAATTPTLTLTYTDPDAGAQTITLYSSAMSANGVASGVYPLVSGASAIAVNGSALAADDIFATVEIIQSQ